MIEVTVDETCNAKVKDARRIFTGTVVGWEDHYLWVVDVVDGKGRSFPGCEVPRTSTMHGIGFGDRIRFAASIELRIEQQTAPRYRRYRARRVAIDGRTKLGFALKRPYLLGVRARRVAA